MNWKNKTPDDLRRYLLSRTHTELAPYGLIQPCRLWDGWMEDGYGYVSLFARDVRVHRVAFVLWVGPIPDGLNVLHRCDRRHCVEPTHLWLGTRADNVTDCVFKGRHGYGREQLFQPGERHVSAKLTEDQVRKLRAAAPREWKRLAAQFGVSVGTARDVRRRRSWRHVA